MLPRMLVGLVVPGLSATTGARQVVRPECSWMTSPFQTDPSPIACFLAGTSGTNGPVTRHPELAASSMRVASGPPGA